jgi:hypothetical protein
MYLKLLKRKEGAHMNKIFITMITMTFLLLPLNMHAQSDQKSAATPPISQALVPEGEFAVKLASALKLGTPDNEAQAEDMLTSVGITPRNGWISDYPMTPDIVGELEQSVATAADAEKLQMAKEDALKAFQDVTTEFGLAVAPGSDQYAESHPPTSSDYVSPPVINNYYYEEGPPVVTYYLPPWDYYYLYAWVPYPFWHSGFFFRGFFVLHDFHRVVIVGHRRCLVSNHFFDHKTKRVFKIDPARRRTGEPFRTADISRKRGFDSSEGRRGATSIFERSRERVTSRSPDGRGSGQTSRKFERQFTPKKGTIATAPGRGSEERFSGGRSNRSERFGEGRDMNFRGVPESSRRFPSNPGSGNGRSLSTPSMGERRGFNRAPESAGRSFSAPSRGFERSLGGVSGQSRGSGRGGGFASGGFSGGRGGGGCKGRC